VATSLGRLVAGPRFNFILMLSFGSIALLLAILGVFGVTHLAVSRRAREIGIRMVLGANLRGMVGMVVRRSAGLALAGVVLGLVMAVALGRAMEAILFRTHPLDSAILGGAAAIMLASSLIAAWLPARRAAQVDPASVLRAD
jgi:ABC-type antimicrobial peptide transport system permease subunit